MEVTNKKCDNIHYYKKLKLNSIIKKDMLIMKLSANFKFN
jgi:hypothetical protein